MLVLSAGIPSADTLRRVMAALDPKALGVVLTNDPDHGALRKLLLPNGLPLPNPLPHPNARPSRGLIR